jgi:hypothetical protein
LIIQRNKWHLKQSKLSFFLQVTVIHWVRVELLILVRQLAQQLHGSEAVWVEMRSTLKGFP